MSTFVDQLQAAMQRKNSVLCVGLDPQMSFMPQHLIDLAVRAHGETEEAIGSLYYHFNRAIIDAVEPYVCALKPQSAFFERSSHTWHALEKLLQYAKSKGILVIKDGKRFDGGDSADAYAQAHIGKVPFFKDQLVESPMRTEALTIGGYIGEDCVTRFVDEMKKHGTGAFVVTKTSFKPNSAIEQLVTPGGLTVWEELAHRVKEWGQGTEGENGYSNLGVVMGATYPDDAAKMRAILPKAVMLVPGYGAQGGGADAAVVTFNSDRFGAVINSSRGIIAAWQKGDFKENDCEGFAIAAGRAAKFARDDLNAALDRKFPKS